MDQQENLQSGASPHKLGNFFCCQFVLSLARFDTSLAEAGAKLARPLPGLMSVCNLVVDLKFGSNEKLGVLQKQKVSISISMQKRRECTSLILMQGCESSLDLTFQKSMVAVNEIFKALRDVSRARTHMKQFTSIHIPGSHIQQAIVITLTLAASYKPLLKQVVEEIYNPDRPDPVDIEHMSSGLTDLLKTGFSMFMKIIGSQIQLSETEVKTYEFPPHSHAGREMVSRPHPSDHPLLIIFMVGGVTVSEVKMVKDLVTAHKPGVQVIVLSTTLLTPYNTLELLFATDHLQPDMGYYRQCSSRWLGKEQSDATAVSLRIRS
ncbi:Sec1 family domain-containing protein 2 [Varanus komodoensis]|nr:Sec1 family domain-containing protein 2 [Varanus komodoensis]